MNFNETWLVLLCIAVFAFVCCLIVHLTFVGYVLNFREQSSLGRVVRCDSRSDIVGVVNDPNATSSKVAYEFAVRDRLDNIVLCIGNQTTKHHFHTNDIVAVRYWPKWPRINKIVDRAV